MHDNMTLLVNGTQAFPEIIRCIDSARATVEINMFIWRDDQIGNRMAEAVLAAAERGVQVNLSVDRYGVVLEKCEECKKSFFHKKQSLREKATSALLAMMYPANGRRGAVRDEYTPLYRRIIAHPNIRVEADVFKADHSKYYIIDGEILFVGGINIEDKENGCDISGRVYGDYMVKMCGTDYVNAFRLKLASGENILPDVSFGVNLKTPVRRFEMEQFYLDMIRSARTDLHITMAYFSPLKPFLEAIIQAHRRGVKVTVILPEKANFQDASNRRTASLLLRASDGQIAVYLSPKMLHTKLVVTDQTISLGSTNITRKAFVQLNELNLCTKNAPSPFRTALMDSIGQDKRISRRVTSAKEIRYPRLMAFLEGFVV